MRLSSFESWTVNEFWKYLTSILFSISLRFKTRDGQCDVNKKMASLLYFLTKNLNSLFSDSDRETCEIFHTLKLSFTVTFNVTSSFKFYFIF